jgi:hypothetical protein
MQEQRAQDHQLTAANNMSCENTAKTNPASFAVTSSRESNGGDRRRLNMFDTKGVFRNTVEPPPLARQPLTFQVV